MPLSWQPTPKEIASVSALGPSQRYQYFIKRVSDTEALWSLGAEDGWVLQAGPGGIELVPVWPHSSYAAACATDEWSGNVPMEIGLDEWMEKWLPGIARDERQVSVFPVPGSQTAIVDADTLREDLEEELLKYE